VAERRRRDEDAAHEHAEDALFGDAADDEARDEDDLKLSRASRSGGRAATKTRPRPERARPARAGERVGLFGRIMRFLREVVAELRKVIWPTRKELLTYTAVVIVFVAALMMFVALLDYGFAKAVLWVFGNPNQD